MANGFGIDLQTTNPGQLSRRQALAQMLLQQGMNTQNMRSPWQLAGNLAQTFVGARMMNQAGEQEQQRQQELARVLQGATGALTAEDAPVRPGAPGGGSRQDRLRGATRMLASNPQTAPMALQMGLQQAQQEPQGQVQTISGDQANRIFGTQLPAGAAVTVEQTGQGSRITDVQEPAERPSREVRAQFQAVDRQGNRMTVLRTNEGLFTQSVDEDGRSRLVPVDSRNIRPVRTQEAGTSSELEGLGSTEARNLRNAEVATRNFTATAADAIELLQDSPDVNTFMGRAASFVNDMQAEARSVANNLGLEIGEGALNQESYGTELDQLGIRNPRMRSLITSLAFQAAAASGQTGRSVSDRDVRRFIEEVGASSADPRAFAQTIADVTRRTVRNYKTNVSVRTGREPEGDFGLSRVESLLEGGVDDTQQQETSTPSLERLRQESEDTRTVDGQTFHYWNGQWWAE